MGGGKNWESTSTQKVNMPNFMPVTVDRSLCSFLCLSGSVCLLALPGDLTDEAIKAPSGGAHLLRPYMSAFFGFRCRFVVNCWFVVFCWLVFLYWHYLSCQ